MDLRTHQLEPTEPPTQWHKYRVWSHCPRRAARRYRAYTAISDRAQSVFDLRRRSGLWGAETRCALRETSDWQAGR
jgi:hypothetical protein